jgi:mycothiol synthase
MGRISNREPGTLPPGFMVRQTRMEDLDAVTDLLLACELADYGSNVYTHEDMREEIRAFWESEGLDLAQNTWVVLTQNGQCVGRSNLWFSPQKPEELFASPRVHPAYRGSGLGTYLIKLAQQRADELTSFLPPDRRVRLHSWIEGVDECAALLLQCQGFEPLRYYWRMELSMVARPSIPLWPAGISIHSMQPGEELQVFEVYKEAFQDQQSQTPCDFADWAAWSFREAAFEPALWLLAREGSEIVGFALCHLDSSVQGATGVIDDLGVKHLWRRRGLGLALLQSAFGAFYQRGVRQCLLGVAAENSGAGTGLYERAGMQRSRRVDIQYVKVLNDASLEKW